MLEVFTRDMVVNENRLVNLTALNLEYNNSYLSSDNNNNVCFHTVMFFSELAELYHSSKDTGRQLFAGTDARPAVLFPPVLTAQWDEQVIMIIIIIIIYSFRYY